MNLDGDKLVLEVDLLDARATDETLELVELALAPMRAQVGVIDLGGCSSGHSAHGSSFSLTDTFWLKILRP